MPWTFPWAQEPTAYGGVGLGDWSFLFDYPDQQVSPQGYPWTPAPAQGLGGTWGGGGGGGGGGFRTYNPWATSPATYGPWGTDVAMQGAPTAQPWTSRLWQGVSGIPGAVGAFAGEHWPRATAPYGERLEGPGAFMQGYQPAPGGGLEGAGAFMTGYTAPPGAGAQGQLQQAGAGDGVARQIQAQAQPGAEQFDPGWWEAFRAEHGGETPEEFYSRRENWKPGAGNWVENLEYDFRMSQAYMGATGKQSMDRGDWENTYWSGAARGFPLGALRIGLSPMGYGGWGGWGGGGGDGGGAPAVQAQAQAYQVGAYPYSGPQTQITMPGGALGTLSAAGLQSVERALRAQGWMPTGQMGQYGYTSWYRTEPAEVLFPPKLFKGAGKEEARKLFKKLEWLAPKKK